MLRSATEIQRQEVSPISHKESSKKTKSIQGMHSIVVVSLRWGGDSKRTQ